MHNAAAFACALMLALFPVTAFSQAGSIGGTVGKADKSVSGGEDQPQRDQEPKARHSVSGERTTPSSINGKWMWTQKCDDGVEFSGAFELTQGSDGAVSGTATGSDGNGSISGKLVGRKLTGTRHYILGHNNSITFTLSGSNLDGSEASQDHGTCKYHAKRS
jgi:hypothetical protein